MYICIEISSCSVRQHQIRNLFLSSKKSSYRESNFYICFDSVLLKAPMVYGNQVSGLLWQIPSPSKMKSSLRSLRMWFMNVRTTLPNQAKGWSFLSCSLHTIAILLKSKVKSPLSWKVLAQNSLGSSQTRMLASHPQVSCRQQTGRSSPQLSAIGVDYFTMNSMYPFFWLLGHGVTTDSISELCVCMKTTSFKA